MDLSVIFLPDTAMVNLREDVGKKMCSEELKSHAEVVTGKSSI